MHVPFARSALLGMFFLVVVLVNLYFEHHGLSKTCVLEDFRHDDSEPLVLTCNNMG